MRDLPLLPGRATEAATARHLRRCKIPPDCVAQLPRLAVSIAGLGLGTGMFSAVSSQQVRRAGAVTRAALLGGINLIDCARNYASGAAETIVGCVLSELCETKALERQSVMLCSKGGYPALDEAEAIALGVDSDEVGPDGHCLAPVFLRQQLMESRRQLGVETIDLYMLHNPEEQLFLGNGVPEHRLRLAFEFLEFAAGNGWIGGYGIASAEGFTQENPIQISRLAEIAEEVAGKDNHLTAIQLPISLARLDALDETLQRVGGCSVSPVAAARELGIAVIASSALNRMRLPHASLQLCSAICPALQEPGEQALNFARSIPGIASALFGTSEPLHLDAALRVLGQPRLNLEAAVPSVIPIRAISHAHAGDLGGEELTILAQELGEVQDDRTELWFTGQDMRPPSDRARALIVEQHRCNFELWRLEDEARRPEITNDDLARAKRAIDKLNLNRNEFIERIDHEIARALVGVKPLAGATMNSETPGMIIDRLSVLSLRQFAASMASRDGEDYAAAGRQAAICERKADLLVALRQLFCDLAAGRKLLKPYQALKLYGRNQDPAPTESALHRLQRALPPATMALSPSDDALPFF